MAHTPQYRIWTDGSCWYKDKVGGWGFLIVKSNKILYEDLGFNHPTTSGRMELTAAIEGLKYFNENYKGKSVLLLTDYKNIIDCFEQKWYREWQLTNFSGISNSDLWRVLFEQRFNKVNKIYFQHVKGHVGIEFNERADFLAGEARKFLLEKMGLRKPKK